MVEKIKEYLEIQREKQIVIFPEGLMKDNNDTLMRFRTEHFILELIFVLLLSNIKIMFMMIHIKMHYLKF